LLVTNRRTFDRRQVLTTAGALAAGSAVAAGVFDQPAEAADAGIDTVRIGPGDSRYDSLLRGDNFRFVGDPDEIRVVSSTDQVVRAVSDAVRTGRRVAARSGGHCFENFTADPGVKMLLDLSPLNSIGFDQRRKAFSIEPGATLGQAYTALFKGWGVTLPAGGCPEVGVGGHFAGGGYGPLSRRYGSVVDYLHGVEVVVVDRHGQARTVVATSDPDDPHRDLWWAHTGGGGGNFGIVTRYFMRSPHYAGDDPTKMLPPAPSRVRGGIMSWAWDEKLTEAAFTTLLGNFGRWHERNSAPGSPGTGLYPVFLVNHRNAGSITMVVQADDGLPNVSGMIEDLATALNAGTGLTPSVDQLVLPWLHQVTWPGTGEGGDVATRRYKLKAGYLRRRLADEQSATIYRYLTDGSQNTSRGMLLIGYGGQVNTVPPQATATVQRDAIMKAVYQTIWSDESDDADNLAWIRSFYRDVYAATGGVPAPGPVSAGSYINYPDVDLADPEWNTSGVPWSTLYYGDNYPRLQRIKARWDPRNVFHHDLGIEA
jgi:aclacinomycin oxidase